MQLSLEFNQPKPLKKVMDVVYAEVGFYPPREYLEALGYTIPVKDLYFITDGEYVKIGIAGNPQDRLRMLQTANARPLKLLVTADYCEKLEAYYHAQFKEHRMRGEWFRLVPEIQTVIDNLVRIKQENISIFSTIKETVSAHL